jgi:predicted CxxxxCH...CXXCH cytochrome family protein
VTKRLLAFLVPAFLAACSSSRQVNGYSAAQIACTNCHGDASRSGDLVYQAAPPVSPDGGNGGAHLTHLEAGVACGACHVVPTSLDHVDGVVDVQFAGTALAHGATPVFTGGPNGACSGVYCHGATLGAGGAVTAPTWSGRSLGCGSCHASPPPSPHPAATLATCSTCHPDTVNPDGSIIAGGKHANGNVDFVGGHPAGWADKAQHGYAANAQGLSACTGCHGTDFAGGSSGVSCNACHQNAGWAAWKTNCTFCHGTRVTTYTSANLTSAAPPVGTAGETLTTDRAVGAHRRHLTGGSIGPAVACTECHVVPGDLGHVNGTVAVAFGNNASNGTVPVWNGTTCASTYCHGGTLTGGSNTAPTWTAGSSQTTCGSCHGLPPDNHAPTSTACGTCHTGYTASTVNATLHMNGSIDATAQHPTGWADKAQHGYAANRQGLAACTSCHGADFNGGTTGVSCNTCHTNNSWAAWQTNCTFCHGTRVASYTSANLTSSAPPVGTEGETAASTRAVGAHQKHLTGGSIGPAVACAVCHTVPTSLAHVTGAPVVTFSGAAITPGATPTWNGTSCSSTYCHGGTGKLLGGLDPTPVWTGGSSQTACGNCHGLPPPNHAASSTTCGTCHTGYTASSVNTALHMNGTVDATSYHPAGWAAKTEHGYNANNTGLAGCKSCHGTNLDGVGGSGGPSCTACHTTNGFANWATNCTFCHGDRATGLSSPPVDPAGLVATTQVSVGDHANHMKTTLMNPLACTACHPDRTGSNVITDTTHVDGGLAPVVLGTLARYNGAASTFTRVSATSASCATTYCHSSGRNTYTTMQWTMTKPATCTSCHGLPPSSGKHSDHSGRSCGDCHPGYTRTTVNKAKHIDTGRQVGNYITTWNGSSCGVNNAAGNCHGSGRTW